MISKFPELGYPVPASTCSILQCFMMVIIRLKPQWLKGGGHSESLDSTTVNE